MHSHRRPHSIEFEAIGTHWQLDTDRALTDDESIIIRERIEDFDRTYSRFRSDSLVTKIAAGPGDFEFPADSLPLIGFYRRLYDITGGAVTPLVGGTLEDLGYDADYRLSARRDIRSAPALDDVMRWDGTVLQTTAAVVLDIGAAGKGYLVDIISALLESFGIATYVVDGSGDLAHCGSDSIRVGMEHPADPSKVIGVVPLQNRALAASAANRRTWGNGLHHIVDPRTGQPVVDVIAGWAVAESAMVADGIATALFFADDGMLQDLQSEFDAGWARVWGAGSINWSTNFRGELFR